MSPKIKKCVVGQASTEVGTLSERGFRVDANINNFETTYK